jgi:hypothetical protein
MPFISTLHWATQGSVRLEAAKASPKEFYDTTIPDSLEK